MEKFLKCKKCTIRKISLHSYQRLGWFVVQRLSAALPSYQRSCSFWKENFWIKLRGLFSEEEKRPKEFLGWPFCVLASHHVHRDQTIFPSKSVSELLNKDWFLFNPISCRFNRAERNLYPEYPLYLYLVEGFFTGQPNVVHAWTNEVCYRHIRR